MFVQVVQSSPQMFDMSLFPEPSPMSVQYIQNQLSNFSSTITDVGKQFMEQSRQLHEQLQNSEAMRLARAAIRSAKTYFNVNDIRPLESLEDLRSATPVMQRYIMAEPELREMYHRQQVDGYSDTYVDLEPQAVKQDHYDWRRVMDGLIDDDGNYTVYLDELRQGDRELYLSEQTAILSVWDLVRMSLAKDEDPTDIYAR